MQRQAQLALIAAEVVAHEIGILGEVDGLEGQAAETLPPVNSLILGGGGTAAAGLGAPLAVGMQIGLNTDEEQINKGGGKRKCLGNHHQTKINCNHKSIKIIMMQTTRPFFSLSFWFWVFP